MAVGRESSPDSGEEGVPAYLLVTVGADSRAEVLDGGETVYSADGGPILVQGELTYFSFISAEKGLLRLGAGLRPSGAERLDG